MSTVITKDTTLGELEQILREEKLEIARVGLVGTDFIVTLSRCHGTHDATAQAPGVAEAIQRARDVFTNEVKIGNPIRRLLSFPERLGGVVTRPRSGRRFQVEWNDGRTENLDLDDEGKRWERA